MGLGVRVGVEGEGEGEGEGWGGRVVTARGVELAEVTLTLTRRGTPHPKLADATLIALALSLTSQR